ncbi:MAG: ester cyclase [Stappiaceae bacterium]
MTNSEVIETWFKRVWAEEDETAIDDMLVPETSARGLGGKAHQGPTEFKQFHRAFLALIGDVNIVIDRQATDGDWVFSLVTIKATRRRDGVPVEIGGQILVKIIDGKIVDAHNHIDFMGLFGQLDLLPCDCLDRCLAGEGFA